MKMTTNANARVTEHLQALGFSEYEGRAYVVLLRQGPLTGYQLARATGIPRPNIYPVLERLQVRGAVLRVEVKGGTRYSTQPADRMLAQIAGDVQARAAQAREALARLGGPAPDELVSNLQGYDAMLTRAETLIAQARGRLLGGLWSPEARRLAPAFGAAQARGVELTTLCIEGCAQECGGCRGHIYRYPVAGTTSARWLVLAADDSGFLAGQTGADGQATAAVTRLPVLVALGSDYLRNAIAAAEIVRSLGPRLAELVDAQALEALQGVGLASPAGSWLGRFLAAARRPGIPE